ncbi:hypothetical protein [Mesorhizobium sp. M0159]|uniref:hypothetical protein n=1 Tax=Mesorhizobium sp. M0159 TaxID=2956900 RepID=UPI003335A34A
MTPLAQYLLNDWCQPIKNRTVSDPHGLMPVIREAKCFECSSLWPFYVELAESDSTQADLLASGQVFAPAPVTFLDFVPEKPNKFRTGIIIVEESNSDMRIFACSKLKMVPVGLIKSSQTYSRGSAPAYFHEKSIDVSDARDLIGIAFSFLTLINTPNIVGRVTHLPHSGLQKRLARQLGMTGKFPLHAWTEITLCIDPSGYDVAAENKVVEAYLSGQKCLHFVRSFLRWRLNRFERVKAHWRGDASLGIKRSRYVVQP